jgi:quercetin dioxygenase-like cupin family protein
MRARLTVVALGGVLALTAAGLTAGLALATAAGGITSTPIVSGRLAEVNLLVKTGAWKAQIRTKGESDVSVVENRIAPGGTFGWHSHPGPSLIVVKQGTVTFYRGDDPTCSPMPYSAGQALIDSGNAVHVGRNEGTTDAVVIVTRFLPAGAPTRIDQPANPACGF